jgi:predicted  nucleic acid-binding Zn-ribbon protein
VRKAYKTLRQQGSDVQRQVEAIQHEIGRVKEQIGHIQEQLSHIKQHLLLEYMGSMAGLAREAQYIDDFSLKKVLEVLHELEMDNLSGKDMQEIKGLKNE